MCSSNRSAPLRPVAPSARPASAGAAPARPARAPARLALGRRAALVLGAGLLAAGTAACGSSAPAATAKPSGSHGSPQACSLARRAGEVAVVVQASPAPGDASAGKPASVVRCVPVAPGATLGALDVLRDAGVETATQTYSFGLAICQVDDVPAHYRACLPSGAPYWALFVAPPGEGWAAASTGVSDVHLRAGAALGLRYDPPTGKAPAPTTAPPLR